MRPLILILTSAMLATLAMLAGCAVQLPTRPSPAPSSGSVLYQEDFSSPTSGWNRVQNAGGIMDYDGGGYRILVTTREANVWSTPHKEFGDVRLEVDAGKLGGPDANRIGLICRS